MMRKPDGIRKYHTAHDRFLKPAIVNFFTRELPGFFGPVVRENIADALIKLFEQNAPEISRVNHGQMVWNALDKHTRADSPNRTYKKVVLTLVNDDDINLFEQEKPIKDMRKQVIARVIKEAYDQGGILSMRDISLFMSSNSTTISTLRAEYEQENKTILPHTGVIHDMGSTVTHKKQIILKHVVEKKPTNVVAKETNHSQAAVDHYVRDYHRVNTLVDDGKDIDYIHLTTNLAKLVISQYQNIINNFVKER
jgi:hypothetical protein